MINYRFIWKFSSNCVLGPRQTDIKLFSLVQIVSWGLVKLYDPWVLLIVPFWFESYSTIMNNTNKIHLPVRSLGSIIIIIVPFADVISFFIIIREKLIIPIPFIINIIKRLFYRIYNRVKIK